MAEGGVYREVTRTLRICTFAVAFLCLTVQEPIRIMPRETLTIIRAR